MNKFLFTQQTTDETIFKHLRPGILEEINKDVGASIRLRDAIIGPKFINIRISEKFFLECLPNMMSSYAKTAHESYNADLEDIEIARDIYIGLYDQGRWTRLRTWRGEMTFKSWLLLVCSQEFTSSMARLGYTKTHSKKSGNTNIHLLSLSMDERCELIDVLEFKPFHNVLYCKYINLMDDNAAQKKLGISPEVHKKLLRNAFKKLKDELIEMKELYTIRPDGTIVNLIPLALSERKHDVDTTNSDVAMGLAENNEALDATQEAEAMDDLLLELHNIYGTELEIRDLLKNLAIDGASKLKWDDVKFDIWYNRYFRTESADSLAQRYNMKRSNVDTTFSRCNDELGKTLHQWWEGKLRINLGCRPI